MRLHKWRKEILFFILALTGAGSSSLVASNSRSKIGSIKFLRDQLGGDLADKFIYAVGADAHTDVNEEIKPNDLIKNLSFYSSSIPLLVEGFAIQTAKQLLEGLLPEDSNSQTQPQPSSSGSGNTSKEELKVAKEKAEKEIQEVKKQRRSKRHLKQEKVKDDVKYLDALKEFLLSKIDEHHISEIREQLKGAKYEDDDPDPFADNQNSNDQQQQQSQQQTQSQTSQTINGEKKLPKLLNFFLTRWKQEFKAGFYVHEIFPYSEIFDENTKQAYTKKYHNSNIPVKPNYFFPDYSKKEENDFRQLIEEWQRGRSKDYWLTWKTEKYDEQYLSKTKLLWMSGNNDSHKNIALKLLSSDPKNPAQNQQNQDSNIGGIINKLWNLNPLSKLWNYGNGHKCHFLGEEQKKKGSSHEMVRTFRTLRFYETVTPMNLFCLKQEDVEHPEFLLYKPEEKEFKEEKSISKKILFYRNNQGFNVIYPLSQAIVDSDQEGKQLQKSNLISEFKKFVEENFSYLLLKYRLHLFKTNKGQQKKENGKCCCDEIIKNLLILIKIGKKLSDWNEIWKAYDIRRLNNDFLKTGLEHNYFDKLGTVSPNPPDFFSERIKKDISKLSKLKKPIDDYAKQIVEFFKDLQASKNTNGDQSKKYWSFNQPSQTIVKVSQEQNGHNHDQENKRCMKKLLADFLLEKIHEEKLIKRLLSLAISFKSSMDWAKDLKENNSNNSSNVLQQVNAKTFTRKDQLKEIKNLVNEKFQNYFKNFFYQNGTPPLSSETQEGTPHIVKEINNFIDQELIISDLSDISDTTIFNLLKTDSNSSSSSLSRSRRDTSRQQNSQPQQNKNPLENIENFLTLINLTKTVQGKDRLNEKLRVLITTLYLMENSFERYREWIRSIIQREGFGVYAFTLSWNKYCDIKSTLNPMNKVSSETFWTPYKNTGDKEWDPENFDARQCIDTMDRYSTTSVKKRLSTDSISSIAIDFAVNLWSQITGEKKDITKEDLMGFKGIMSREMPNKIPKDIYSKVSEFLHSEGYINWKEIKDQIDLLKTNREFKDYIDKLTRIDSKIGEAFKLSDYKQLREGVEAAKEVEVLDFVSLKQKKDLLNKFIDENIFGKKDLSLDPLNSDKLIEISVTHSPKDQKRFQGLLRDPNSKDGVESYTISSSDLEDWMTSSSYLIQVTTEDLKNDDAFYEFAEKYLTPQMLLQDIVKQARIQSLQSRAINHFLSRGSWANDQKVNTLRSSDYYLKNQFTTIIL
ncbi:DUF3713 domain-containing protein [Mycoplasma suis]|uniref:Uncharacterized protein n=1 Tax=Mycoplasma suis (strain Illinois) TaxID=768700 RepID=F0QSB3_MYCSL|nr:DUF3713 domain-containing protein [Mycoplasma suis]ADX98383.1 hypothetical protein MSU_0873 [Mycoplasma suis str. Illinois]